MALTLKETVRNETLICLAINIVIASAVTYLTLPDENRLILLGGPESGSFGIFPASLVFTCLVTLLMGKGITTKIIHGKIKCDGYQGGAFVKWLPRQLLFRAIVLSLLACGICAPVFIIVAGMLLETEVSYLTAFILNVGYVLLLSLMVVPLIVYSCAHHCCLNEITES